MVIITTHYQVDTLILPLYYTYSMKQNNLVELRQEAFKCPEYRRLEKQYLNGIEPVYDISNESVELLEESDAYEKLEEHQINLKECEEMDEKNIQLRDNHLKTCDHQGCKGYFQAINKA